MMLFQAFSRAPRRPPCVSASDELLFQLQFVYLKESFSPSLDERISVLYEVRT
jgi:hypothetical protein